MKGFPLAVRELEEWVPHRAPMVWIDEVSWADTLEGECLVRLRADAPYMDGTAIRPSSMIEWIAQGYAYVRAAQARNGLIAMNEKPKRAFLAAIRDATFEYLKNEELVTRATILRVKVRNGREFGPLSLVEGCVLSESGEVLARAKLKVYAE